MANKHPEERHLEKTFRSFREFKAACDELKRRGITYLSSGWELTAYVTQNNRAANRLLREGWEEV